MFRNDGSYVDKASHLEVATLREEFRREANFQIIGDSLIRRGLAQAYVVSWRDEVAGYGAKRTHDDSGEVTEFFVRKAFRPYAHPLFEAFLRASEAKRIVMQTNWTLGLTMLYDFADEIIQEAILFDDAGKTDLVVAGATFRPRLPSDRLQNSHEPEGDWVLDMDGSVVANGGYLSHYNPPFVDLYMEVLPAERRKGYGSLLIQEIKRIAIEEGKRPSARCNPDNVGSRRTLERAGFLPCGRLLSGRVVLST